LCGRRLCWSRFACALCLLELLARITTWGDVSQSEMTKCDRELAAAVQQRSPTRTRMPFTETRDSLLVRDQHVAAPTVVASGVAIRPQRQPGSGSGSGSEAMMVPASLSRFTREKQLICEIWLLSNLRCHSLIGVGSMLPSRPETPVAWPGSGHRRRRLTSARLSARSRCRTDIGRGQPIPSSE
jgi:hypothetical protein